MDPNSIREILLAQHQLLRDDIARCRFLASRLCDGEFVQEEFDQAVEQLRTDFLKHNDTEAALIQPLLAQSPQWGALLVDRMLEEHVAEHGAFWDLISRAPTDVAQRIDELVEDLGAHMDAEERTFLSSVVLRDDVIERHRQTDH